MNAAVDDVIAGRTKIRQVPAIGAGLEFDTGEPVKARKPRAPNKKTREALEEARREGFRQGFSEAKPDVIGLCVVMGAALLGGLALGALIF